MTPNFTAVALDDFKRRAGGTSSFLSLHKGGGISLSVSAVDDLDIKGKDNVFLHFLDTDQGPWIYVDQVEKNGLKIRFEKKDPARAICQCSSYVNHLIKTLDLPIADDRLPSVKLELDVENAIDVEVEPGRDVTAFRLCLE